MSKPNKKIGARKPTKKQGNAPKYTVDDLLQRAEDLMSTLQLDMAAQFYHKAYELEPNNTEVLDAYGYLLLELEQFDQGKQLLEQSIKLEPLSNPMKYLTYAQGLQGQEAVAVYNKGIELLNQQYLLLQQQFQQDPESVDLDDALTLKQQIVGGFCSLAEIYLTDECFADNAESECERYLSAAIEIDNTNPEPFLTLASVRMSQNRNSDALELVNKSYNIWKDVEELEDLPTYEFRHNTAKLFLELEQHSIAADIWDSLIAEEDQIAEVHYFQGLAYRALSSTAARESVVKAKELLIQSGCDDEKLLEDINELTTLLANENIEKLDEMDDEEENGKDGKDGKSEMEM